MESMLWKLGYTVLKGLGLFGDPRIPNHFFFFSFSCSLHVQMMKKQSAQRRGSREKSFQSIYSDIPLLRIALPSPSLQLANTPNHEG